MAADIVTYIRDLCNQAKNGDVISLGFTRDEMRNKILEIQSTLKKAQDSGEAEKCELDVVFPLKHYFAPKVYAREMTLPAGHWIIGKIHRHSHLNFVTKGRVAVITEDGVSPIAAPYTFVSSIGTKRLVLVLEETLWTTVHVTDKTDLLQIENEVIAPSYEDLPAVEKSEIRGIV